MPRPLVFALTGWVVGAIATVVVGLIWPVIFPAIVLVGHYYGAGPNLLNHWFCIHTGFAGRFDRWIDRQPHPQGRRAIRAIFYGSRFWRHIFPALWLYGIVALHRVVT